MAKVKGSAEPEDADATVAPHTSHGLTRVTNLLALLLVRDMKTQAGQIAFLDRAGFPAREIAALLGTTRNTVSVELSKAKKTKKNGNKKAPRGTD